MYPFWSLAVTIALTLTAPAEPDPEAILRSAIERVQSVEVATGRIEDRSLSQRQGEEDRRLSLDATMMLKRMAHGSELGWAIAYEAKVESTTEAHSGEFKVIYDGQRLLVADIGARTAFVVDQDEGAAEFLDRQRARHARAAWHREFSSAGFEVAFNRDIIKSLRHLGTREYDGVECDVVEYVAEMSGFQAVGTWYLGRDDGVLRRYHEVSRKLDGTWRIESETSFLDVRINEAIGDLPSDAFVVKVPEEFEQVAYVPARPPSLRAGAKAPAFSATDVSGRVRTLDEFRGKVIVLDFWATWCLPCRRAMPVMQAMHEQWRDEGLEIIGVSCWEQEGGDPSGYFAYQGYTYTSLIEGDDMARDYRVSALPTVVVIGRDGRILLVDSGWGESKEERLRSIIAEALKEETASESPTVSNETKKRVLEEISAVLRDDAFALSGIIHEWPSVMEEHAEAIVGAADDASFVAAVNVALRSLGVSHLNISARNAATGHSVRTVEVGTRAVPHEGGLLVTRVLEQGPACQAGIRAGDLVLTVCGEPATSMRQLTGAAGDIRSLSIRRDSGETHQVEVPVQEVPVSSVAPSRFWPIEVFQVDADTVVIVCDSFEDGYIPPEVTHLLAGISVENIIIDLRDNQGGFGFYAGHFVSHFMPPGTRYGANVKRENLTRFVEQTGFDETALADYVAWYEYSWTSDRTGHFIRGPIVVLVSEATASAGEVAAQSLREFAGATVIGTTTAGKVLAGSRKRLTGGFSLYYPSTDYVTAKGYRLEGSGIVPDVPWTAPRKIDSEVLDPAWIVARDHLRAFDKSVR